MSVPKPLDHAIRERARGRCQYCRMHQSIQGASFHIEHVVPSSLGGLSDESNLVLACPSCNLHKSDRIEALDPDTGAFSRLFHPLVDRWEEHFRLDEFRIIGATQVGRATVAALHFNQPRRLKIREAEASFGLFPPS